MDISGDSGPPQGNPNSPKWGKITFGIMSALGIGSYLYCSATGYSDCEDRTLSVVGGNQNEKLPAANVHSNTGSGGSFIGASSAPMPAAPGGFAQFYHQTSGASFTTAQSTALTNLYNAFTPTNQTQTTALQNVFASFSKH
jgi:hypothetical protein